MENLSVQPETPTAFRVDLGAIFVSLELSKSTWLVTSLTPGSDKMSRHSIVGGDIAGLLTVFTDLRRKAQARLGKLYPLVAIQEAGLDGFWIHRVLDREAWIESHVVMPPRLRCRADTDGQRLIELMARR